MNRETIREKTMQLIYQMDVTGDFDYSHLSPVEEDAPVLNKERAIKVLEAVRDHIDEIDTAINSVLDKWTFERISKTDLAILRNAAAEMMYIDDLPVGVSINEAVRIAKLYSDEKSYAFVNSVLGRMNRNLEKEKEA
jgi:N utilization substance protein B